MAIGRVSERLAFLLELDASQATAEVRKFGTTAERELGKVDSKLDRVGTRMQVVGAGMLAAAGLAGRALYDLGQDAAALEQAVGGTEAVFGDASETIDRYAERAAEAAGLSERAFREATTRIGGGLVRMGFEVDDAAERSSRLTQVAADLAATYGGTTVEAVDALAAAYRGEADPAERFNLNLKVSEVNARAVELGLAASTSAVDDRARALALESLIFEQSAAAQGQYAREADTATGRIQTATAQIENFKANAGQTAALLTGQVASALGGLAQRFNELDAGTQATIGKLAAYGTATVGAIGATSMAAGTLMKLRERFLIIDQATGLATGGLNKFGKAGIALAAIGLAATLYEINKATEAVTVNVEEATQVTTDELLRMAEVIRGMKGDGGAEDFFRQLAEGGSAGAQAAIELRDATEAAGISVEDYDRILAEVADEQARAAERAQDGADALDGYGTEAGAATDATEELADAHHSAASSAEDHRRSVDEVVDSMRDFTDEALGGLDAIATWEEALDNLTSTLDENGTTLDLSTEAGRENFRAGQDIATGLADLIARRYEETGSIEQAIAAGDAHVEQLKETMRQAGASEDEIAAYIFTLGLIPRQVATNVDLDTQEAMARIRALGDYLASVTRQSVTDGGYRQTAGSAHAAGGRMSAGQHSIGGERGFELYRDDAGQVHFIPGRSGEVIPNHRAAEALPAMSAGGAPLVGTVNLYALDVGDAMRQLHRELAWTARGGV